MLHNLVIGKLLLLLHIINDIHAAFSGLYVDNGEGQTVVERFVSRKEKLQFERDMLNILGLSRKPRKVYNSSELETSAPKFLLDIYKSLDGSEVENEFNLKSEDIRAVEESDAIMTFLSHTDHVNSVRHEKGRRLWFDVSDVPAGDTIVNAELRLYKQINERTMDSTKYTVNVYQVMLDYKGDKQLEYIDSTNVTGDYEGWLVLNVSAAILNWVAFPSTNKGLYFSVHKHSKSLHEIHPENIGIVSTAASDTENQKPFMVAFLRYGATSQKLRPRRIRDTSTTRKKKKSEGSSNNKSYPFAATESAWSLRNCQIQTLYVNFKDLNWHEWIIAPEGYAAYYCNGLCDFPLNAQMNATNHAIVQTLVHLVSPQDAPKACCVPTKLGSIAVLYYLEDNNVILKKYRNMIAKSCGCH